MPTYTNRITVDHNGTFNPNDPDHLSAAAAFNNLNNEIAIEKIILKDEGNEVFSFIIETKPPVQTWSQNFHFVDPGNPDLTWNLTGTWTNKQFRHIVSIRESFLRLKQLFEITKWKATWV